MSEAVTPAQTAAQLRSMSCASARARNVDTNATTAHCSTRCTSEGFQIRPQAVKYPLSTLESDRQGRPKARILRLSTVRASPIQRKPIGSAKRVSSSMAALPKNSA